jgi:Fe-S cluster biogenesis protein NfuA
MGIFGIRNAIKRTVNTLVGKPDIVAGKSPPASSRSRPAAPSPPAAPPVVAQAAAPEPAPVEVAAPPTEPVAAKAAAPPLPTPTPTPAATEATGDGPQLNYDEVWELLDDMVRPALQGDGGDISLIKVEDNDVHVRLTGACSTCPSSIMTMKMGVEALLREEFPQMRELVQHDA